MYGLCLSRGFRPGYHVVYRFKFQVLLSGRRFALESPSSLISELTSLTKEIHKVIFVIFTIIKNNFKILISTNLKFINGFFM